MTHNDWVVRSNRRELDNVVATMELVSARFVTRATRSEKTAILKALQILKELCGPPLPQQKYLADIRERGLTRAQFQILTINTIIRVAPSYFEIPLNVASAAIHGNLTSYGVIVNNANDEAGHGNPHQTHPALLNKTLSILCDIFAVRKISFKTALAALTIKARQSELKGVNSRSKSKKIVQYMLALDEFNTVRDEKKINEELLTAVEYAQYISPASIMFYKKRMKTLCRDISQQNNLISYSERARLGDISLAAQLAVRESDAADPNGFIELFNREIVNRYLGYISDIRQVVSGKWWGDVHVDPDLGIIYGYKNRSSEDDHAEQSTRAMVERINSAGDIIHAINSMNSLMQIRTSLWEGTVALMKKYTDRTKIIKPKPLGKEQLLQAKKQMLQGY